MRKCSGKNFKNNKLIAVMVFIIGIVLLLGACAKVEPVINITTGEGRLYAGATVPLSAEVYNLSIEGDVEFVISQDQNVAEIDQDGNLIISETAPTGATFEVTVTVSGYSETKAFIVGKTPVESIELEEIPSLNAGDTIELQSTVLPVKARENEVTYEIISGKDKAEISGNSLHILDNAKNTDDIRIVAVSDGVSSEEVAITILTIPVESILMTEFTIYAGETFELECDIAPANCTEKNRVAYLISGGSDIAQINGSNLIVSESATVGNTINVFAKIDGTESNSVTLTVAKKDVEEVYLRAKYYEDLDVMVGETRELEVEIAPINSTVKNYSITIISGSENIEFDTDNRTFEVTEGEIGSEIKFKAISDGEESAILTFTIIKTPVESVSITTVGETVAVSPGETRTLSCEVLPTNATYSQASIEIEQGAEFVTFEDSELIFSEAPEGMQVILIAYADGVASEPIIFTIVSVPVESITISTSDNTVGLEGGDVVIVNGIVEPVNATRKQLTYSIVSGNQYGEITANGVFTVNTDAMRGTVEIIATSADGINSNTILLDIYGTYYTYIPESWDELDNQPNIFNGKSALWLDLKTMPLNADGTTIIVSESVTNIVIEGGYLQSSGTCIENLKIYFLSKNNLNVTFINLGIITTERFGGTVIDFSTEATIALEISGENYIEAGSPYAPYIDGFTVDGVWSTESTNYIRMHGMDGYGGYDGGTAISAKNLTVTGSGNLNLVAGNGSSGTDGGDGGDTPAGVLEEVAGNGGRGGYGGNSGYAIFADKITINMTGSINALGGNGGTGGVGGAGGVGSSVTYNGSAGANGANGIAFSPIYAYTQYQKLNGTVDTTNGSVVENEEARADNYIDFAEKLEKHYKVDIHYGNDYYNPYEPTIFSWRNKYKMTKQNDIQQILRLLYGLEGAFTMFPANSFIELSIVNEDVNIYLVNTIKNSSGGVVYGLTNSANNIWFATFDTKLRDTFYSTYYNIMVHEMLHLFTFSMGSTSSNPMKSGLPSYNLGYSYTTNSTGVYNPQNGYGADNSAFLTAYSKTDFNEDISDNLSLICMLVYRPDFLNTGKALNLKAIYIANTYRSFYRSYAYYMPSSWERMFWEY